MGVGGRVREMQGRQGANVTGTYKKWLDASVASVRERRDLLVWG